MSEPSHRPSFTARSPVDLVAVVPYLLGFRPADSAVLLTFGPGETFHARVDLPDDEADQDTVADLLADVVRRHGVGRVAVLLYADDPWVAATFHDALVPRLLGDGVEVVDVLRVAGGRFHDAADVDDPGTPYDLSTHAFTAEQVFEGRVALESRDELAASLDPVDRVDAAAVAAAAAAFAERLLGTARAARRSGAARDLADEARWVQAVVRRHVAAGTPPSVEDAGRLLVLVALIEVRDVAWAEMSRDDAARHVDLWTDLVRRCPGDLMPGAAGLLAFAAWLSGHGALAWCALDRCTAVDPAYSMAECIGGLLVGAVPPSVWTPITDDQLPVLGGREGRAAS